MTSASLPSTSPTNMSTEPRERSKMVFRMEREERFQCVRRYLRRHVLVAARRSPSRPSGPDEHFAGHVEQVAWGLLDGADVMVLVLTGPQGQAMPMVALELGKIISMREVAA